jgi:hypothetical protein
MRASRLATTDVNVRNLIKEQIAKVSELKLVLSCEANPFIIILFVHSDHINACDTNPCLNGGTCASSFGLQARCICPSGYKGPHCEGSCLLITLSYVNDVVP